MAGRLLGGSWCQMAAEDQRWSRSWWPLGAVLAALGPLLPRLGQLLAPLGAVLGLPGRSPEAPGQGLGGLVADVFEAVPQSRKFHRFQTCLVVFKAFFEVGFRTAVVFVAAAPARPQTLKNRFSLGVCVDFR